MAAFIQLQCVTAENNIKSLVNVLSANSWHTICVQIEELCECVHVDMDEFESTSDSNEKASIAMAKQPQSVSSNNHFIDTKSYIANITEFADRNQSDASMKIHDLRHDSLNYLLKNNIEVNKDDEIDLKPPLYREIGSSVSQMLVERSNCGCEMNGCAHNTGDHNNNREMCSIRLPEQSASSKCSDSVRPPTTQLISNELLRNQQTTECDVSALFQFPIRHKKWFYCWVEKTIRILLIQFLINYFSLSHGNQTQL